ncbi:hypothetical protein ACHAWF_007322 [Thalassiosira exigua]
MAPLYDDESCTRGGHVMSVDTFAPRHLPQNELNPALEADRDSTACEPGDASADRFLYYSDNDVRLRTLKMVEAHGADVFKDGPRPVSCERKTRMSFELHDSLIMEDLLDEMCSDDDMSAGDGCDLFKDVPESEMTVKMNLLRQLLDI